MAARKEITVRYEEQQCTLLLVEGAEPEALSSALFAKLGIQGMSPYLTEVGGDAVVPLTAALPASITVLDAHTRATLRNPIRCGIPHQQRALRQRAGTIDGTRARTRSRLESAGSHEADADLPPHPPPRIARGALAALATGWAPPTAAGGAVDRRPESPPRAGTYSTPSQSGSPTTNIRSPGDPGAATAPLLAASQDSPPPLPCLNQAGVPGAAGEVFWPGRQSWAARGQESEARARSSLPKLAPEAWHHSPRRVQKLKRKSSCREPDSDLKGIGEDDEDVAEHILEAAEHAVEDVADAVEHILEAAEHQEEAAEKMAESVDRFSRLSADLANERTLLAWTRTSLAGVRTVFAFLAVTAVTPLGRFSVALTTWACAMVILTSAFLGFRRYQVIRKCLLSKEPLKDQRGFGRSSNWWMLGFVVCVAVGTAGGVFTKAWVKG